MNDHYTVNGREPEYFSPPLKHPRRSQSPKKFLQMQAPQLVLSRPAPDTILVQDDRFAHFLPALLAGPLFSAAKWLGGKAIGAVGSLLGGGAKAAVSAAKRVGSAVARKVKSVVASAPPAPLQQEQEYEEEYAEPEEEELEYEEDGEEIEFGEEYENDQFDVHIGHDAVAYSSPRIAAMSDEEWNEAAARIGGALHDSMSALQDSRFTEPDPEVVRLILEDIDFEEPDDRFAHFSFKKAFKKVAKVAGPLLSKIGPVASLIPGVGTAVGMAASVAGKLLGGASGGSSAPAPSQVVEQLVQAAPQQLQQLAAPVQQAVSAVQALPMQLPTPSMIGGAPASGFGQWTPPPQPYPYAPQQYGYGEWGGYYEPRPSRPRRRRRAPPPPPDDDNYEEEEFDALPESEYSFTVFDGETELETGGRIAKAEVRRAHTAAKAAFARAERGPHRDSVTR